MAAAGDQPTAPDAPELLNFSSGNWGTLYAAYQHFLKEAWDNEPLGLRKLILSLETEQLRAGLLRLEHPLPRVAGSTQHQWVPEQRILLPGLFWRTQYTLMLWNRRPVIVPRTGHGHIEGEFRLFAWLPDLSVPLAGQAPSPERPPQPDSKPARRRGRLKAESWASDIVKKLKRPIPEDNSALADLIIAQMVIETADDPTLGDPPTFGYVRTSLREWRSVKGFGEREPS
jgi:hypothetical protein